jgi:cell division protein FtsW (lipid II flippase)
MTIFAYIWEKMGFWGLWFLSGLIYTLINMLVRKLHKNDDFFDPWLAFSWLTLAPIMFIALIVQYFIKLYKKYRK